MHYETTPACASAMRTRIACALALAFAVCAICLAATPSHAHASEPNSGFAVNKADFYSEAPAENAGTQDLELLSALLDVAPSDEMRYFAEFESHKAYDATFSSGDNYNAMGYYQFDRRYGLQNFIAACYEHDPVTFAMFEPYAEINPATEKYATSIMKMTIREKYTETDEDGNEVTKTRFTKEADAVNAAWKAAYAADPVTFSALQDAWAYEQYYLPAEKYLRSRGIEISNRADCVKGLCWGMCNLFGSSGWRKFVGGVSDGYDWDGVYHHLEEGVEWPGCGLTPEMTDVEFVTTLCNYVVDNVAVFYKGQPQYHKGWQNRYKKELAICLEFLADDQPQKPEIDMLPEVDLAPDVKETDWFVKSGDYAFVVGNGLITGYTDGPKAGCFGATDTLTRAQAVTILWRCAGEPAVSGSNSFSDVLSRKWYTEAINWAVANKITTGYTAGPNAGKFGTDDKVTREQLATFIYRYATTSNPHFADFNPSALNAMADAKRVSPYSKDALAWCVDKGIITGVSKSGKMHALPQDYAQRAAMAAMVHRMFLNLV